MVMSDITRSRNRPCSGFGARTRVFGNPRPLVTRVCIKPVVNLGAALGSDYAGLGFRGAFAGGRPHEISRAVAIRRR